MRVIGLCGLTGCGAAIYFPVEPPPFDTDPSAVDTDRPDTDPPDTDLPTTDTDPPTTDPTPTTGGLPCSFLGGFYADLHVVNQGTGPLNLYWRDFYCSEVYYGQIAAGGDLLQGTYEHQAWVVRDPYGPTVSSIVVDEAYEQWELP